MKGTSLFLEEGKLTVLKIRGYSLAFSTVNCIYTINVYVLHIGVVDCYCVIDSEC